MLEHVNGLSLGDHQEHLPEVGPILQAREAPAFDAAKEAVEGAQGDVLLILGRARDGAQLDARQADQPAVVAFP
jgi:hypothetical protein